jgi:putative ABC transport system permease protein
MTLRSLVWKELAQRPAPTITALLAVALGVAALVSVQSLADSSEAKIGGKLQQLGANVLVLPEGAGLQDYYTADMHGQTLPEEYATRIVLAQKVGVEELAPKLCVNTELNGRPQVVTGILPRSEFRRKSAWGSADLLLEGLEDASLGQAHEGCQGRACALPGADAAGLRGYARTHIVDDLPADALLVGSDAARRASLMEGDVVTLFGEKFRVAAVLEESGTIDDGRLFAHLHTVQRVSGAGPVVNVIEVMSCCEEAAGGLVGELSALLPGARIVTISQIVQTQVSVNRLMDRLSYVLFGILMLVGGAGIAGVMFSNVSERRRELGTLMALGATPRLLSRLILWKASIIGLLGGLGGLAAGAAIAAVVGPWALDVAASPSWTAVGTGCVSALVVAWLASYLPARKAAALDPCLCFQEV